MWKRLTNPEPDEGEERRAETELRSFLKERGLRETEPAPAYWQNFVVRANQGIDDVSSGKALSISWAARVALPGALAILFFFIGIHYYVPDREPPDRSVSELMLALPADVQDSLAHHLRENLEEESSEPGYYDQLFEPAGVDAADYLSVTNKDLMLETLPDSELDDLLRLLREGREL